jgi:hypothetical protein
MLVPPPVDELPVAAVHESSDVPSPAAAAFDQASHAEY